MTQRSRTIGDPEPSGALVALLPLAMVFAAIAFLAVGAGGGREDKDTRESSTLTTTQAAEMAEAEKAAAEAVVAISLARVASPLPEEALDPPKPKAQQPASEAVKNAKATAKRDGATHAVQGAGKPTQVGKAQSPEVPPVTETKPIEQKPDNAKPKDEGVLARLGSYAPSPSRIAGALSDGVSKLASYIPGL